MKTFICLLSFFSITSSFPFEAFIPNVTNHHLKFLLYKNWMCPASDCCSCAPNCMATRSCCINAFWNESFTNLDEYINYFVSLSKTYKEQECVQLQSVGEKIELVSPMFMVTSCLKESRDRDREKCYSKGKDFQSYTPVIAEDNYIYKNMYCAKCNRVKNFQFVSIHRHCKNRVDSNAQHCVNTFNLQSPFSANCVENRIFYKQCPKNNEYYDLCRSFEAPIVGFANQYCRFCNGSFKGLDFDDVTHCEQGFNIAKNFPFSWSALIQLTDHDRYEGTKEEEEGKCSHQDIFDKISSKCISFSCPPGYQAINSTCSKIEIKFDGLSYMESDFDQCMMKSLPKLQVKNIKPDSIILMSSSYSLSDILPFGRNGETIDNSTFHYLVSNEFTTLEALRPDGKVYISANNFFFNHKLDLNISQAFLQDGRNCSEPIEVTQNVTFTPKCDVIVNGSFIIGSENISMWIRITHNRIRRYLFMCKRFHLADECHLKIIMNNATLAPNGTLLYKTNSATTYYQKSRYIPDKVGGFWVCKKENEVDSRFWYKIWSAVTGYLSLIGSACSVLCYIFMISSFCYFKDLRTFAGYCACVLHTSLLSCDGLYLIANVLYLSQRRTSLVICHGIGILIHFFLLFVQVIGAIISIDILQNINKMPPTSSRERYLLIKYGIISFGLPFMIIVLGMAVSSFGKLDVSYAANGMCMLHGFYPRLFLYFIPLAVCFITSLIAIMTSTCIVSRTRKQSKKVLRRQDQEKKLVLAVALRLIILSGVPEGLGLVNIPSDSFSPDDVLIFNAVFGMLYSLLKGFRGVLLFISFVKRRKVMSLYQRQVTTSSEL